jgi:ABC-2 type transport system permease protein
MSGAVFTETLRRNWRAMLYWGVSVASLVFITVIIVPSVEMLQKVADMLKIFPPAVIQAFGSEDAASLATPEGYLSMSLFSILLLVFAVYAILAGLGVTANEEDQGIMDMMISLPIARWRIVLEKLAAYTLVIVGMILLTLVGFWLAVAVTPSMTISAKQLIESVLNMLPGSLLMLGFTALISTLVRRRNTAAGIAAAFLVASYFIDLMGRAAKGTFLDSLRTVSFYSYYDYSNVMSKGLNWGYVILVLAVAGLLVAGTVWAFRRRDVGV